MRKITSLIAGLSMLGWVVSTHASIITVDIADASLGVENVIYLGSDPVISTALIDTALDSFDLAEGSSKTIDLFNITITTDWASIGVFDVTAAIDFALPSAITTEFTDSGLLAVAGTYAAGILTWEPDSILTTLADDTIFSVELQDVSFFDSFVYSLDHPNTIVVSATLSNLGVASVPEPSTLALMGFGLLAIGFSHRRRKV